VHVVICCLVQVDWYRLLQVYWYKLLQVDSGSGLFSENDRVSTFGIYISGWLDGERKGGYSLLVVGVIESESWRFLQVGA
jgi:hypothetical protein